MLKSASFISKLPQMHELNNEILFVNIDISNITYGFMFCKNNYFIKRLIKFKVFSLYGAYCNATSIQVAVFKMLFL